MNDGITAADYHPAMPLPSPTNVAAYRAIHGDDARFEPAIRTIAARHRLDLTGSFRARSGGNVTYVLRDVVIKLVAPLWPEELDHEELGLRAAAGRLSVATPSVSESGTIEGWRYAVITRLPGIAAGEAWPSLSPVRRISVASQLGGLLRELHALPAPFEVEWAAFERERRERFVADHRRWGLSEPALAALAAFIDSTPPLPSTPVFLHADVTDDQLLLAERDGAWEIVGLFDFGDATVGPVAYDFVSPAFTIFPGEPACTRAMLAAYGTDATGLLYWSILHQFNDLARCLGPADANIVTTLRERYIGA